MSIWKKNHSIVLGKGLTPNKQQAITWNNDDPVLRRIFATLGGDELTNGTCINDIFSDWSVFNYPS